MIYVAIVLGLLALAAWFFMRGSEEGAALAPYPLYIGGIIAADEIMPPT